MFSSLQLITHNCARLCLPKYVHSTVGTFQNMENRQAVLLKRGLPIKKPIDNITNIVLIASSKGGVGKSTTAVNLAVALKLLNPSKNVGLLDADIFGPSLPLMMNLHDTPLVDEQNKMLPLNNYGIKCMSMGFLIKEGAPVIWRGLMVMQALEKLIRGVNWGPIDCLIIDTPPGTSDTHLSLVQNLPIAGAILVTTPQTASLQVTKRGAVMFEKLKVPIIGLVQNMSSVQCPRCLNTVQLFGNATEKLAQEINVSILETIPLANEITICSDVGIPIVVQNPRHELSHIYKSLANKLNLYLK